MRHAPRSPSGPALLQPEFYLLLLTMAGGLFGLSALLSIGLCFIGLSLSALPKYVRLYPECRALGLTGRWLAVVGLSCLNSLGTASASYVLGRLGQVLLP